MNINVPNVDINLISFKTLPGLLFQNVQNAGVLLNA